MVGTLLDRGWKNFVLGWRSVLNAAMRLCFSTGFIVPEVWKNFVLRWRSVFNAAIKALFQYGL